MAEAVLGNALPNLVVIGAMRCGTTAVHRCLDRHPDVAMSRPKELNFFFDTDHTVGEAWARGNWARGLRWYAQHFDRLAPVRGESSPGYTSPDHAEAASRMAAVVPDARLVYLVRDPVQRALSQYRLHRRDGTETRPLGVALLDPDSHYLARSRYYERLGPFLDHFDPEAITVLAQEELSAQPQLTLRIVFELLGVAADRYPGGCDPWPSAAGRPATRPGGWLRDRFVDAVRDDAERLFAFVGRDFPGWLR
jgi:hypothetical protein